MFVVIFVIQGSERRGSGSADAVVAETVSRLGSTSVVLGPGLLEPSEDLFHCTMASRDLAKPSDMADSDKSSLPLWDGTHLSGLPWLSRARG